MSDAHLFVEFRERLVLMQDETAQGHVFIALRQVQVILSVDLLDLQSGREHILMVGHLFRHQVRVVVLILNLTRNLLDNILEGHQSGGATKLIDHHRQRAFLGHERLHQFRGEHGLRDETNSSY